MDALHARRLRALTENAVPGLFDGSRCGVEREALRVAADGTVSTLAHPRALGSALTHPSITTDFSEALLELITPPLATIADVQSDLDAVTAFVYRHVGDELLWATSMPCVLGGGESIPLARYGSSNAASMKTAYRRGLGNRYGRVMQVIAGVHFNYSFGDALWVALADADGRDGADRDYRSAGYMAMVRNLQRIGWLVPYLFGASPAVCKSFVQGVATDLESFDAHTYYDPFATSLRLGDIGYQNSKEEGTGMKACYDSLDAYVRSLTWAIETPCPDYEQIGVKVGGQYEQLNDHVLQIENEYYSTVRPKQITDWMEKPTLALRRRGVRYAELRSLDVNPYERTGVCLDDLYFLETLLLHCLITDSPVINATERRAIDRNQGLTAQRGRDPALELQGTAGPVPLRTWARELLQGLAPLAELLDGGSGGPRSTSLRLQLDKVRDASLTPSARMLDDMRAHGEGFYAHARRLSEEHRAAYAGLAPDAGREAALGAEARASHERQRRIEAADSMDFDTFLGRYFAQTLSAPVDLPNPLT